MVVCAWRVSRTLSTKPNQSITAVLYFVTALA
jgi:hypothetical protein